MSRRSTTDAESLAVAERELANYQKSSRALIISMQARQNALAAVLRAVLVTTGSLIPAADRRAWIDGLYAIGQTFNEATDSAGFADFSAEDLIVAAEVARESSAALTAFVDGIVAALPPE